MYMYIFVCYNLLLFNRFAQSAELAASFFQRFLVFHMRSTCVFIIVFVGFLCVFEQVQTVKSIKNTAQAAVIFYNLSITWDPLQPLWDSFWSHFCNLGTTFGALWLHLLSKKTNWGARGATRGAKVKFPNFRHPFGHHLGVYFPKICSFFLKLSCFFIVFSRLCFC